VIVTTDNGNTFELKKTVMLHKKIVDGNGNRYRANRKNLRNAFKLLDLWNVTAPLYYEFRQPRRKTWEDNDCELELIDNRLLVGCMVFSGKEALKLRRWIQGKR
jgi:hypothetical protein